MCVAVTTFMQIMKTYLMSCFTMLVKHTKKIVASLCVVFVFKCPEHSKQDEHCFLLCNCDTIVIMRLFSYISKTRQQSVYMYHIVQSGHVSF